MNAWFGLLKKEYRVNKNSVLIGLLLLLLAIFFTFFFGYDKNPIAMFVSAVMILIFHVFYPAVYLFFSLHAESKKLHLWLHNSQSGRRLLGAKLLNIALGFIISFLISFIFTIYTGLRVFKDFQFTDMGALLVSIFVFIEYSFYLAMWLIFLWVFYQVIRLVIGKYSWILFLVIITLGSWLTQKFMESELFHLLTDWGKIDITSIAYIMEEFTKQSDNFFMKAESNYIYLGNLMLYAVISIGLFLLSSWLLDKKVEVQ